MKKLEPQTKSFIILVAIALGGGLLSLTLLDGPGASSPGNKNYEAITYSPVAAKSAAAGFEKPIDTSDWKTYASEDFNFSFQYKPDWVVKPAVKKGDYQIIEIDPGRKFYNIRVYISPKDYFGMGSLPTASEVINGNQALNVSNMLYGLKNGPDFYTFDVGLSTSLRPEFQALVKSVVFAPAP